MAEQYQKIRRYLEHLRDGYNVQICIKDFCGFIPINKELDTALQPFLTHTNPYCMYLKSDRTHWHVCLSMIRGIYSRCCREQKTYFGICHGGLGEYVIPIFHTGNLLGSIHAGFFPVKEGRAEHRICRTCAIEPALDPEIAKELYHQYVKTPTIAPEELLPGLEMLAEYLAQTYQLPQYAQEKPAASRHSVSSEDVILTHALEYIRQNFHNKITVVELAEFCHCSETYLSRIFKRHTRVTMNVYINKIRLEEAKHYLTNSQHSIAEIAGIVGFGDPNYFSRVFSQMIGISPTEFRRRFQKQG